MKLRFLIALTLFFASTASYGADANDAAALIANTIKDAGVKVGVNNELRVDLVKGRSTVEELAEGKLEVTKIDFDTKTGLFRAYISSNGNLPFETAGNFREVMKLPVLTRKFSKNEIITREDISFIEVDAVKLKNNYVTNQEELVGKAPIRQIYKSRPIAANQITEPKVVEKNKQVTMVFNNNALKIQDTGVALESGSIGQTIKFRNLGSNRVVSAKVVNENTAEVQPANAVMASN